MVTSVRLWGIYLAIVAHSPTLLYLSTRMIKNQDREMIISFVVFIIGDWNVSIVLLILTTVDRLFFNQQFIKSNDWLTIKNYLFVTFPPFVCALCDVVSIFNVTLPISAKLSVSFNIDSSRLILNIRFRCEYSKGAFSLLSIITTHAPLNKIIMIFVVFPTDSQSACDNLLRPLPLSSPQDLHLII